eukprot:4756851-Pyramimonas_sp.AAC.1
MPWEPSLVPHALMCAIYDRKHPRYLALPPVYRINVNETGFSSFVRQVSAARDSTLALGGHQDVRLPIDTADVKAEHVCAHSELMISLSRVGFRALGAAARGSTDHRDVTGCAWAETIGVRGEF